MHWNTPYAGADAGVEVAEELPPARRRQLRRGVAEVAARTRELLPDEYVVGTELTMDTNGPRATVAVRPPVGEVVAAGYAPDEASDEDCDDLVRGLAASAALAAKRAMPDDHVPVAR